MKHLILSLLTLILSVPAFGQANGAPVQKFFELPIIPDSIQNFQRRCDYMVTHYWDFCDLKKAFSSRDKMADAFNMYLSFMPYASADAVFSSVDKFIGGISKKPADVQFIAELAERALYTDSAEYQSEELYSRFLDGILATKKLDKSVRPHYEQQAAILHNSQEGMTAPEFDYIASDGSQRHFKVSPDNFATLLMFVKPGDSNANMARLRLDADIKTAKLVKSGRVRIVCIATEQPTTPLPSPDGWDTGYSTTVSNIFNTQNSPTFYILDSSGQILKRGSEVEPVLNVMQLLRAPRKKQSVEAEPSVAAQ